MYDLNDNPISSGQIAVSGFGFAAFSVKIDCRAGYRLRAMGDVSIAAQRAGDSEWTDLIAESLPLGEWDGSRETFDVRVSGSSVTSRQLRAASLIVEPV